MMRAGRRSARMGGAPGEVRPVSAPVPVLPTGGVAYTPKDLLARLSPTQRDDIERVRQILTQPGVVTLAERNQLMRYLRGDYTVPKLDYRGQ